MKYIIHSGHSLGSLLAEAVPIDIAFNTMPSFLVNGNLVSTQSYYPEQRVAGEFLAQVIIDSEMLGEGIVLYDVGAASIGWYNLPFMTRISGPLIDRGAPDLQEFAREGNQGMVSRYIAGGAGDSQYLFWTDESAFAKYEEWFGPDVPIMFWSPCITV